MFGEQNNCLHEILFEQALQRAEELDHFQRRTGTVLGPLHGVPISLKDQFYVKGVETTMGYVGWINTVEGVTESTDYLTRESVVVKDLWKLGAVLYCKVISDIPRFILRTKQSRPDKCTANVARMCLTHHNSQLVSKYHGILC